MFHRLASVNGWGSQSSSRNAIPSRFTVSNWLAFQIGQPFLQCSLKAPPAEFETFFQQQPESYSKS